MAHGVRQGLHLSKGFQGRLKYRVCNGTYTGMGMCAWPHHDCLGSTPTLVGAYIDDGAGSCLDGAKGSFR